MERNIFSIVFAGFNIVFADNNKSKMICDKITLTVKALCLEFRVFKFLQKRGIHMNNVKNRIAKLFVGFMTLTLFFLANSTSCYYIHQPEEPEEINDFKWIK